MNAPAKIQRVALDRLRAAGSTPLFLFRLCCFILLPVSLVVPPTQASADGWRFPETRPDWGRFGLGFLASLGGHELGHYVVATAKGYDVHFDGVTLDYSGPNMSDADHLQVASAGFQAQWLMTEFALRDSSGRESEVPPGEFGAGVVCAELGVTLAYLTFLKNHNQGDVYGMAEATGLSRNEIALALAIPAILDGWRLFGNRVPKWVPQVSLLTKGIGIAWVWTY
jgi:hypothetical protein